MNVRLCAAALLAFGCSDTAPEVAVGGTVPGKADGDACARHAECASAVCVPVLPEQAEKRGVCWGPALNPCVLVLGVEHWASASCDLAGMADALCPPILDPEMVERCFAPEGPPSGEFPYSYACCETTYFE